ncbi:MAG: SH3 domain-containing protein [Oscillospiraceae bacterium]|nr:SH3 domain-containing protein [Oscillospiraceae bacterium]
MNSKIRIIVIVIVLTIGLSFSAVASEEAAVNSETSAIVNNYNHIGLLNLRAEPSISSERLMQYYTGTEIAVIEDVSAEWAKVRVGYADASFLEGYMMKEYLAFGDDASKVEPELLYYRLAQNSTTLVKEPVAQAANLTYSLGEESGEGNTGGDIILQNTDMLTVMGIMNGWHHVQARVHDPLHPRADENGYVTITGFIERTDGDGMWQDVEGRMIDAKMDFRSSQKFSDVVLNAAASKILIEFSRIDSIAAVDGLRYDEARSDALVAPFALSEEDSSNWIAFFADFRTGPNADAEGFEPNTEYTDWIWILCRENATSPWEIVYMTLTE